MLHNQKDAVALIRLFEYLADEARRLGFVDVAQQLDAPMTSLLTDVRTRFGGRLLQENDDT
jgi:hypothetical protein